jgi:hypothetical protein
LEFRLPNAAGKIRLDVYLAFVESRSEASGDAHAPCAHLDKSDYKKESLPTHNPKSEIVIIVRGGPTNKKDDRTMAAR